MSIPVRGRKVRIKVWLVDAYGNAPLYLLDTNLPENDDRWITGQLYGWFGEERVAQEMVLGIGGIRALRALGYEPEVYHLNEGHAVFAGVELIREKVTGRGLNFSEAWEATREEIVFTTRTPVKEGNESHRHSLRRYMGAYDGLNYRQMRNIGGDPFSMTMAALRLSRIANGVSELHRQTARGMWSGVVGSAPIISITNGVHPGTWQDSGVGRAHERGEDLWAPHIAAKRDLVAEVLARTGVQLNPEALLVGFGRRAAPYKRSDLIFRDPEIVEPLLRSGRLQMIFSGKAHPLDDTGKEIVANLVAMAQTYPESVVFLQDYDMKIGRLLTRGCDVWLNNPRLPLEASGTSGMKAAMNGVLNLSVLNGWWPEGCQHGVNGWQIGGGYEGPEQDEDDLKSLYEVLLDEVIPTYYDNRSKWLEMMRASIDMSHRRFSSERMREGKYYDLMYRKGPGQGTSWPRLTFTASPAPPQKKYPRSEGDSRVRVESNSIKI